MLLGLGERVCGAAAVAELAGAGGLRGAGHHRHAVVHQQLVLAMRPVPFQHGELRMVQRAALAVAEAAGELEDAPFAGRQQLLAGEFRRGAQEAPVAAGGRRHFRPHGMDVGLVAGGDLQDRGLDLDEFQHREQVPQRPDDLAPGDQERSPLGMRLGCPEAGSIGHQKLAPKPVRGP